MSIKVDPTFVTCRGGYAKWYTRKASDPNVLTGAVVGGPDAYDNFADERDNYEQTEPATYNNAPLLGVLARLSGGHAGYNQLFTGIICNPVLFYFVCGIRVSVDDGSINFTLQRFSLLLRLLCHSSNRLQ